MKVTEKLLGITADSVKMPGWNDALSMMIDDADSKSGIKALSMEELDMVAGGKADVSQELLDKLHYKIIVDIN